MENTAQEIAPTASQGSEPKSAGVFRRLGAMFYDALLIIALWMVATALLLPFTGGEAITSDRVGALEYAYRVVLIAIFVIFFGVFWTRRGQTLGMAAWKLRVQRADGAQLKWSDVLKRLAAACVSLALLGLGYFWIWIDRDRLAWHDRWTGTRVVVLPKKK
jgi:uncharacterized RDD family membrane protein YckC